MANDGASGTATLDNHRRFGRATVAVVMVLAGVLTALLSATGHARAGAGLVAGAVVACADGYLLSRTLTRFSEHLEQVRAGALTMAMMSRFVTVAALAAVLIAVGGMDAIGVLAGLLLLPVSIVGVALWSQAQSGRAPRDVRRARNAAAR